MTPLALKTARQLLASDGERSFLIQLLASACFDLSPVGGIVRETGQELLTTLAAEHRMEHGGLPAPGQLRSVVIAALCDLQFLGPGRAGDAVDQAILKRDAARPPALEIAL